jgi:hypothetical protein
MGAKLKRLGRGDISTPRGALGAREKHRFLPTMQCEKTDRMLYYTDRPVSNAQNAFSSPAAWRAYNYLQFCESIRRTQDVYTAACPFTPPSPLERVQSKCSHGSGEPNLRHSERSEESSLALAGGSASGFFTALPPEAKTDEVPLNHESSRTLSQAR